MHFLVTITMKIRMAIMIAALPWVTSCAPAIPKESLRQVDPDITFQALVKNPDAYRGKVVLLGGQIMNTTLSEGATWVEVLQRPLDWRQRPKDTDESYGRFLVRFPGFQDPAIYSPGKKITVLGEVAGKKSMPLGNIEYLYPELIPREQYLWKPEAYSGPAFHIGIGVGGVFH